MKKSYSPKIEENLNGTYTFNLEKLVKLGWKNTTSSLSTFVPMLFIVLAILLGLAALYVNLQGLDSAEQIDYESINMFDLVVRIILAPIFVGLMMHGAKVYVRQASKISDLFQYVPQMIVLCLTSVLISLLTLVGMALFILPGLYVILSTGFASMLVADKKISPLTAIVLSITMVNRYLTKFIGLYLLFLVLFVVALLTYGIGLILFFPFYFNVKGILYADLFGYAENEFNGISDMQSEGSFEA